MCGRQIMYLVSCVVVFVTCIAPTDMKKSHKHHKEHHKETRSPPQHVRYPQYTRYDSNYQRNRPYFSIFPRFDSYRRYPNYDNYYGNYYGNREDENYRDSQEEETSCGVSLKINQLIVNGEEFDEGTYPWLVALFSIRDKHPVFICGGTLVSRKHIITAAHCVVQNNETALPANLVVVLGKCDLQKITLDDPSVYKINAVHPHPEYKFLSGDGDIAVLELQENQNFTDMIKPACLWSGDDDLEEIIGERGIVAGWGKNENATLSLNRPKSVTMPIVSQETCLRSHSQFVSITSDRTFCAGDRTGSGPCNGDSGGGMVMKRGGRWLLRGLVSLSLSSGVSAVGCDLNLYIVFTDVSKFTDWLYTVIK